MSRRIQLILVAIFLAIGVFIFWRFNSQTTPVAETPKFEYRLKWLANAGFVGDLYSDAYGLYRGQGLRVTVVPGGPDRDGITALLRPNSDTWFAVASSDQVISAIYRGGNDLRVVAQVYAVSPVRWIYRASLGPINGPKDLVGKRIGVAFGDNDEAIMRTYMKKNGISAEQVTLVGVQFDYGPFLSKAVDMYPVYSNTQGVELARQLAASGEKVAFFDPSVGPGAVRFAANSIVTTSRIIAEHPDVVRRFLTATLSGWNEAISPSNRSKATNAVVLAINSPSADRQSIEAQVEATAPIVKPTPSYRLGTIDVDAWKDTEETLFQTGRLKSANGQLAGAKIGIQAFLEPSYLNPQGTR